MTLGTAGPEEVRRRVEERIGAWRVAVERTIETESAVLVFGRRGDRPVVLKVVRRRGDEWRSGAVLEAFEGRGVVRVLAHEEGAMLLERLNPATSLAALSAAGRDDEASQVLARIIGTMSPQAPTIAVATVEEWGHGFERYAASGDTRIPARLVAEARRVYSRLCDSQTRPRLLHGDLHHDNARFDAERGWVAIDPKGAIGEVEYEVGAALRNPHERPELFAAPDVIERRVGRFADELELEPARLLGWGFAQAVLSAIWAVEDGFAIERDPAWLALAEAIRPMLKDRA